MMGDLDQLLADAQLRYTSLEKPGYSRQRKGKSFVYFDTRGRRITDAALIEWMNSLAIPPAWEDVWISPKKNNHILAVGRDARGRKQYRYHPRWQAARGENKFGELAAFGKALPHLRETVDKHLRKPGMSFEKVLALVVYLLERTLIRVGNAEYMRQNKTFGLTTLKDKHVSVSGSTVSFQFVGKSHLKHEISLTDRRLARAVKACRDIPGYELFQYIDEDGKRRPVNSADVNAYLRDVTGQPFTAKVFRTWGGSVAAIRALHEQAAENSTAEKPLSPEKQAQACIACVAELLGNTKAVCKQHYIHPAVLDSCMTGSLADLPPESNSPYALRPEEQVLMQLIDGG